jgi:hypothetical protein
MYNRLLVYQKVPNNHIYIVLVSIHFLITASEQILPQIPLQQYDVGTATTTTTTLDRTLQTDTSNGNFVYEPILHMGDTRVLDSLYGMDDTAVDPKIDFIKNTILLSAAQKWAQHLYVRPTQLDIRIGSFSSTVELILVATPTTTPTTSDRLGPLRIRIGINGTMIVFVRYENRCPKKYTSIQRFRRDR